MILDLLVSVFLSLFVSLSHYFSDSGSLSFQPSFSLIVFFCLTLSLCNPVSIFLSMLNFDSLTISLCLPLNFTGLAPHLPELMSLRMPLCPSRHSGSLTRQVAHLWPPPQQGPMEQLSQGLRGYPGGLTSRFWQCLLLLQG